MVSTLPSCLWCRNEKQSQLQLQLQLQSHVLDYTHTLPTVWIRHSSTFHRRYLLAVEWNGMVSERDYSYVVLLYRGEDPPPFVSIYKLRRYIGPAVIDRSDTFGAWIARKFGASCPLEVRTNERTNERTKGKEPSIHQIDR
jgi:hypothetical protein